MARLPDTPTQAQIIAFLSDPDAYQEAAGTVQRIETHCSVIFLAGEFAYKLKKQVKFSFLDFSTLDKRLQAARNELLVNRRYAAALYLQLAAVITDSDGNLSLLAESQLPDSKAFKSGKVVEWLVVMRRFKQQDMYSSRAEAGAIDDTDAHRLASMVLQLHARSPRMHAPRQAFDALQSVQAETLDFFKQHPHLLSATQRAHLLLGFKELLERQARLLRQRAKDGYFRHCHGDLHLANITRLDEIPVAFDAIEFDDRIATIDVLYDLAFLLMDLWRYRLLRQANLIFNAYLADAGETDIQGLALMPLFLAARALVRLQVTALKADQGRAGDKQSHGDNDALIQTYADLADQCLDDRPPLLIGIGGLSGTGKTTLARAIAPQLGRIPGALILRSDVERKLMLGAALSDKLPTIAYSEEVTDEVYQRLWRKAGWALSAGHSVIVDAVNARAFERDKLRELAASQKVGFTGLWLQAPDDVLLQRVETRTNDASDADQQVVRQQLTYDIGPLDWQRLDSSKPIESSARAAQAHIESTISYQST